MPQASSTRVRYAVVAVTALMAVVLYLDRFCISFAEIFIKEDLGLTDVQVGWMLSAFFWTYALGQVPSGWLTDRFGSRVMLTTYVAAWSLLTGMTGLATAFRMLLVLRFGFGLAQAGAYPTGASIIGRWMPPSARATASSLVSLGGRIGGWLALFASGPLVVWLTARDTPATFQPQDVLDAPRLCYELSGVGPDATGATARGRVWANLSGEAQKCVRHYAAIYEHEQATQRPRSAEGRSTGTSDVADGLAPLVKDLNRIIARRGFFAAADLEAVALEREARRLLKRRPEDVNGQEVQRLNRLVLESLHRDSLRKLYGHGWRLLMVIYGSVGLVVGVLVWRTCHNRPADHPRVNPAERALIEADAHRAGDGKSDAIGDRIGSGFLTSRSLWLISLSQFFTNVGWVFLMTWAPRYFQSVHHIPVEQRAVLVSIPPLVGWLGTVLGGVWTDYLMRSVGLRWSRALPIGLSRLLAGCAYLACLLDPSPWAAVAIFSAVAFATDWSQGTVWAYCQDVGGRYVGSALGWTNMWGNLGAAVTPPLLIWIVGANQNWPGAFLACAAAFLLAGLLGLAIDATRPIRAFDMALSAGVLGVNYHRQSTPRSQKG